MADSTQYTLWLVITANNQAIDEINKLWKSVDSVKWNVVQLSETTKKVLKWVWVAATAVAWTMVALWKSFVDSAMEAEPLERSFNRLAESAWIASDEMLDAMKKASKWTVSDTKLMSAANTALSLNVVKSADDMATLMEIARVKGQAMWRSMEEALDDIVRWLWRSSPMILDNLWIVIKQSEAQEIYAKELWKTVDQLTEAEKKQALVNAVVKQWKEELLATWELQLTMAERLQIVNAQRENTKKIIWDALLPVIQRVLEVITPVIQKVADRIAENPKLTANIMLTITAIAWLIAVVSWLALALPAITTAIWVLSWPIWRLIGAITLVAVARKNNRWWIQEKTKEVVDYVSNLIWPRIEKIKKRFDENEVEILTIRFALRDWIWWIVEWAVEFIGWCIEWMFQYIDFLMKLFTWDFEWARTSLQSFLDTIAIAIDNWLTAAFWETRENIKEWVLQFYDRVVAKFTALKEKVLSVVNSIKNARNNASEKVSWAVSSVKDFVSSPFRAWWWDVFKWQSYIVWERWPELFVPNERWSIVPTNQITNNNWIEINMNWITVRNDQDIQLIADEIARRIKLEKDFWIIS